jgi:predicted permease
MRLLAIFRLRLRSLFVRSSVEHDLDDELRFHLEKTIERNIAAGMSPEDARFAARREFGNPELQKDECRDSRGTKVIEDLFEDLRYAARGLGRNPLLALAATATLALCIGANTTVFSLVNSILIRPLPYPGADRIYYISDRSGRNKIEVAAGPDYYILRKENRVFEDVAAYAPTTMNWSGVDKPEQIDGALVTPSFFRLLGTEPLLGRYLAPAEEGPKAPPVVVLSYAFWRNRLGSDPRAVGKTITLDRLPHTIIGVMPQGFDYPPGNPTPIWAPLEMDEASQFPIYPTMRMRIVSMLARRRPQVSPMELETEMRRLSYSIRSQYPKEWLTAEFRSGVTLSAIPLQERLTGDLRPALLVLTASVGLVLLIACVNLANLLLARATGRQRELAVRLALGSSQGRIVRQMLTESVVLALPGGLAGAAVACLAVVFLNTHKPLVLVRYPPISLDTTTLVFTFALTMATGLVFGLAPAFASAGVTIHDALKSAGHTQSSGRRAARLRHLLLVAELGISLVLLIGAGLLARSFLKLANRELGFPADHLLTLRIDLTHSRYATVAAQKQFYNDLLQRVEKLPMVREGAASSNLPLGSFYDFPGMAFQIGGRPVPIAQRPMAGDNAVSPQFFHVMGIPLQSGRIFESQDASMSPVPVVVNEAFVRKIFLGENPLGKRLEIGPANVPYGTVIGVVGNIRGSALGAEPSPLVYRCICASGNDFLGRMGLLFRTTRDPQAAIRPVEEQVSALDRDQPLYDVRSMEERLANSLAPQRFQLILIGSFAAIALLLAAAGVYAVMSYLVTQRAREIGIRMAMGAQPKDVVRLVAGESAWLVAVAAMVGLAGAWALTRYVRSLLYGVTTLDAPTFTIAPVVLALIVFLASMGPARRASSIDAIKALRDE